MAEPEPQLRTARLLMRRWREPDRDALAAINADPEVMEFFPAPLGRLESDALLDSIEAGFERHGFGLWALQRREPDGTPGVVEPIGFAGLAVPSFEARFTPAVEVGWRLARSAWGHGYATEAGQAALSFGFERVGLKEIVAMTSAANRRSWAVMERLGMSRSPAEDFEHPRLAPSDPLRPHVLYRIAAP